MTVYVNKTFKDLEIKVSADDVYDGCTFDGCVLRIEEGCPVFRNCETKNTDMVGSGDEITIAVS